jgi:hypothetical protein
MELITILNQCHRFQGFVYEHARFSTDKQRSLALHILDRFHIVAKMNKALDEVRAEETRRMASEGRPPVLKKSRWLLLKREENLKTEQRFRLRDRASFSKKLFSSFGITTRPPGPRSSSMSGAGKRCVPVSNP